MSGGVLGFCIALAISLLACGVCWCGVVVCEYIFCVICCCVPCRRRRTAYTYVSRDHADGNKNDGSYVTIHDDRPPAEVPYAVSAAAKSPAIENVHTMENYHLQSYSPAPALVTDVTTTTTAAAAAAKRTTAPSAPYQDVWALAVFTLCVAVISALALTSGSDALGFHVQFWNPSGDDDGDDDARASLRVAFAVSIGLALAGAALSIAWVSVMVACAPGLVNGVLWGGVVLSAVAAALVLMAGPQAVPVGIVFVVIAAVNYCYARSVQPRVPFASANLSLACAALRAHAGVFLVALGAMAVQLAWGVVWLLAFYGVFHNFTRDDADEEEREERGTMGGLAYFGLVVGFYWGLMVVRNLVRVTVAGTVATWWFKPDNTTDGPVVGSLKRACTTSFGSVCLGSLVVSVIHVANIFAKEIARRHAVGACLISCLCSCIEDLVLYFNRWAFCFVGIYGYNFRTSGASVMQLFETRGFTAVVNDDLIDRVLAMCVFVVGLITSGAGLFASQAFADDLQHVDHPEIPLALSGFLAGVATATVVMGAVDSAVATVFVCFAHDPTALQTHHPEHFRRILDTWSAFHPGLLN